MRHRLSKFCFGDRCFTAYDRMPMSHNLEAGGACGTGLQGKDFLDLWTRCSRDTNDTPRWTELLGRIAPKIKLFTRITLRQKLRKADSSTILGLTQESDFLQMTIIRLVQNDCAAMRRFSGSSEDNLFAYLAVITRSVIRDFIRRQSASRRPLSSAALPESSIDWSENLGPDRMSGASGIERNFLAQEVTELSRRTLENLRGQFSDRDRLIFELYFFDGLSPTQISRCEGFKLTKLIPRSWSTVHV